MEVPYRVVVAGPEADGHDGDVRSTARALRDAGFEVIYAGTRGSPEQVVEAVLQEDADAVGLPCLSDAEAGLPGRIDGMLGDAGLGRVVVFGDAPVAESPAAGGADGPKVFGTGTSTAEICTWLRGELDARVPH